MNTEVIQFDTNALKQRVSDTVRAQFGMLIPEDEWSKLVEREVHAFFSESAEWTVVEKKVTNPTSYRSDYVERFELTAKVSPFRAVVWEAVRGLVAGKLSEQLNEPALMVLINHGSASPVMLGEVLAQNLEAMVPKMVAQMFAGVYANAAIQIKSEIVAGLPKSY